MEDTLLVGDSVLVQRWPKPVGVRGDVIVFPHPLDPHEDYVKRIVGVSGDRLRIANKILYRNGAPVIESYAIHKATYVDYYRDNFPSQPNTPLQLPAQDMLASHVVNNEVVVPTGKYFVLGDNRDDSLDKQLFWLRRRRYGPRPSRILVCQLHRPSDLRHIQPPATRPRPLDRLFRILR